METAGRTNDVDETYKQVIVTQADVRTLVSDALDRLFSAYTGRDLRGFMLLVSPDFVGDDLLLERAVADDFGKLDDIRIAYSIVSVSSSSGGRMFALISYDRSVVSSKDGKTYRDSGLTELTLTTESDGVKIYSMKQPIIFGVSGATDIAAGTVSQDNGSILHVDDTGQATLGPPDESGTGETIRRSKETITLRCSWGGSTKAGSPPYEATGSMMGQSSQATLVMIALTSLLRLIWLFSTRWWASSHWGLQILTASEKFRWTATSMTIGTGWKSECVTLYTSPGTHTQY